MVDSFFDNTAHLRQVIDYYNFEKGAIKKIQYYKMDRPDSIALLYYPNGQLRSKRYHFQGRECFERIDYRPNGNLSQYIFLSSDQTKFYIRLYDSVGVLSAVRGRPFFESFLMDDSSIGYSETDTISSVFFTSSPPDCQAKLFTVDEGKEIDNIYQQKEGFIFKVDIGPLEKGAYELDVGMNMYCDGARVYSSPIQRIKFDVY